MSDWLRLEPRVSRLREMKMLQVASVLIVSPHDDGVQLENVQVSETIFGSVFVENSVPLAGFSSARVYIAPGQALNCQAVEYVEATPLFRSMTRQ
jgi:hypothetical protein